MILTGKEIVKQRERGSILLSPFSEDQLNPNSYNYRLSEYIAVPDSSNNYITLKIPEKGFMIEPETTYLSHTYESLGSSEYAMSLIGRSSLGRLGLFLQIDADLGHTTSNHNWTLEIVSCKKFILYPKMIIGQISFWENSGEYYNSEIRYNKFNFLHTSLG